MRYDPKEGKLPSQRPPSNHATHYLVQDNNISQRWSTQRATSNTPIHAERPERVYHNSMGCIDNSIIDKTTLEEAKGREKNLSCTWIDVKEAFDSVNNKWLALTLQMHNIPAKITNFITNTMKEWFITIEVKIKERKDWPNTTRTRNSTGRLVLRSIVYSLSEPNCPVVAKHRRVHVPALQGRKDGALALLG